MKSIEEAVKLRKAGLHKQSNELLTELAAVYQEDAFVQYQCAWSYDLLGKEREAVPYYEKAIQLGLEDEDAQAAYLGLGSTYRTLGEYENSRFVLEKAIELYPANRALSVFYAMTLHNLNRQSESVEILLKQLLETTSDAGIIRYSRALSYYADKLDQVWK